MVSASIDLLVRGCNNIKKINKKLKNNLLITIMTFKNLSIFLIIFFSLTKLFAAEEINKNGNDLNFFIGNFDFSDSKQSAYLIGFQHQDENLNRNTFLGNVSPITGGFVTENSAAYIYTGIEWNVDMGEKMLFTPSFAPGLYHEGNGKDLGHILEFKSEVQLSYAASNNTSFGVSYNHVSNASLGDKNPGANSYMFNFLKNF